MFTIQKTGIIAIAAASLFTSCQQNAAQNDQEHTDTAAAKPSITVSEVGSSPEFPDAQLSIRSVTASKQGSDSVKLSFAFDVKNYELKMQTSDTGAKQCNNSAQGQHIHFIMDNEPYKALYEPVNEVILPVNSEHYLMAFLSRSYHESLKNRGAALVYHFRIDAAGKLQKLDDPKEPMIFYSRPKGDYLGRDTKNVLFDFYVWDVSLSADGYRLKADISSGGNDTSMVVADWKPLFLHGLSMGQNKITISLLDKDGNAVQGANTRVSREFRLAEDEPMK